MHPDSYQGPGLYRHYKGDVYLVDGLVTIEATGEAAVLYEPTTLHGRMAAVEKFTPQAMRFVRSLKEFNAMIPIPEGEYWKGADERPRFELVSL
jgi:hypothetical protein